MASAAAEAFIATAAAEAAMRQDRVWKMHALFVDGVLHEGSYGTAGLIEAIAR